MICLYHDDLDGQASAACVYQWVGIRDKSRRVKFIPMDYRKDVPFDEIAEGEQVWIVDFSLQKDGDWEKLLGITNDVTWIDHHKTAIDRAPEQVSRLPGLRRSGTAACVLTFRYIHHYSDRIDPIIEQSPDMRCDKAEAIPVPHGIKLIGDRDVWTWEFGEETAYFCAGLGLRSTEIDSKTWGYILSGNEGVHKDIVNDGKAIIAYKSESSKRKRESISFQTEIDGHKALAMNAAHIGSAGFGFQNGWKGELPDEWPILMPFYWDGSQWTVSLYSKSVDVSEIAKKRGGGGHTGAAGFQATEMPNELKKTP